jgi:O-antigen/teichoic acid export membrane protein|nr:flippase [Candidatus Acidoferrales bacterium]
MTDAGKSAVASNPESNPPSVSTGAVSGHGVRVMQNTAVVFISRWIGLLMAGAASVMLTRALGPERLGEYAVIYSYLALFGMLSSFGIGPILTREAAQNREYAGSILFTGMCLATGFAITTGVLALAISPLLHLNGKLFPLLAIAAVEIFLLVPVTLSALIFQVDQKQWYSSGFSIIRQAIFLSIVFAVYLLGAPLLYVILGRLAAAGIEAGLNFWKAQKLLGPHREFLSPVARRLIHGGFVISAVTIASTIYLRIDQVMLHAMAGDFVLGHYAAAVRVSELFEALPAAFGSALFPLLCISLSDAPRFRRHIDIGFRYMVLAGAGLSVVCCLGARPIMHLYGGAKYSGSAPLLAVLIWSEIPIFFASTFANALLAANLQKFVLWPTIAGAALNIGLNFCLIPHSGALGASWATVIAYWFCWTLVFIPIRASREMFIIGLRLLIPITALALAITGFAFLIPANDWIRVGIGAAAFALLACVFRFARRQDLEFLRAAWKTRLGLAKGATVSE